MSMTFLRTLRKIIIIGILHIFIVFDAFQSPTSFNKNIEVVPDFRIIPDNDSIGNEEIKQISSKQYSASSSMSAQSSIPVIPVEQISHNLDTSTSETMAMRESASESSPLTNEMNQSGAQITGRLLCISSLPFLLRSYLNESSQRNIIMAH